jgi:hypothetical protein
LRSPTIEGGLWKGGEMKNASAVLLAVCLFSSPIAAVEERIGTEIVLDFANFYVTGGPAVASDGLGAYVVWIADDELRGARIDGAGTVNGPFVLATSTNGRMRDPAVASSGHGALVAWAEEGDRSSDINIILLDTDGQPVHAGSFTIDRHGKPALHVHVAFDGFMYHVLWQRSANGRPRNYTQRVGTDGSRWTRRTSIKVGGMTRYPYEPDIACLDNGQCLVTWLVRAGAEQVQGARLLGDELIDSDVIRVLNDAGEYDVVAGADQYLVLATRSQSPCGQSHCPVTAAAARVDSDGTALEFDGFAVDNDPGGPDLHFVAGVSTAFDGQNYVATFMADWSPTCAYNVFGARIASDGTVSNPDVPGSVVSEGNAAVRIGIAGIRAAAVAAWNDRRDASACTEFIGKSVRAQMVFPHDPPPLPVRNIGTIGNLAVAEQQALRFVVGTPGLDPGTTSVAVTNMPAGAVFDAATRTFQWLPYANQSDTYSGVHFEASDATQTISEDVTFEIAEGSLSLCGVVDLLGVPKPNVAVRLKGGGGKPRTVLSDADGRFCFFHLIQAEYNLTLDRLSRRDFVAEPLSFVVADGDVDGLILSVRPR